MPSTFTAACLSPPARALTHHYAHCVPRRPAGGRGATSTTAAAPLLLPASSASSARRHGAAAWIVRASVSHSHSHVEDDLELMSMAIHTLPRPSVTTTTGAGTGRHHAAGHSHSSRHPHEPQHQHHEHDQRHHQHHQRQGLSAATTPGTTLRAGPRPTGVLRLGPTSDTVRVMSQLRDAVLRQGSAVLLVHDGVVALEDAVDVLVLLSEDVQEAEPGCIAVFQPILSRHSPTCPPHGSSNGGNASCDVGFWTHGPAAAQHGNGHFSGGHGPFQHGGGEAHSHTPGGSNASGGGADFALLVSKVPATMTTPRCPVGVLPIRASSDSDCLDLADLVTVKLSHPGCSTRVRCSHTGRALSTMLRAIVCARRRLRGGVAGGGDIVVEPQVVFEADEHSVDTAALYLNVWRLGH